MEIAQIVGFVVVIVIAFCEAAKQTDLIPSRFIPLLALVLGMIGTIIFVGRLSFLSGFVGVILGLASTGGYRLIKTTILNK